MKDSAHLFIYISEAQISKGELQNKLASMPFPKSNFAVKEFNSFSSIFPQFPSFWTTILLNVSFPIDHTQCRAKSNDVSCTKGFY